jgi:hypothetical protein
MYTVYFVLLLHHYDAALAISIIHIDMMLHLLIKIMLK